MKHQIFLHAPSHLFLLIFLNIFSRFACGTWYVVLLIVEIIEMLILCLNKVYRIKDGQWIIVPRYRIVEIILASMSIVLWFITYFGLF